MSMLGVEPKGRPVLLCGPGRVKQEFAQRSDIKDIVARYKRTGMLDYVAKSVPMFADVVGIGDFRSVVSRVVHAREAFERLPATVRNRFSNDPASLIEFLEDDSNRPEAIRLGLVKAPVVPAVVPPAVVPA